MCPLLCLLRSVQSSRLQSLPGVFLGVGPWFRQPVLVHLALLRLPLGTIDWGGIFCAGCICSVIVWFCSFLFCLALAGCFRSPVCSRLLGFRYRSAYCSRRRCRYFVQVLGLIFDFLFPANWGLCAFLLKRRSYHVLECEYDFCGALFWYSERSVAGSGGLRQRLVVIAPWSLCVW
jgi:hypothetical protein